MDVHAPVAIVPKEDGVEFSGGGSRPDKERTNLPPLRPRSESRQTLWSNFSLSGTGNTSRKDVFLVVS